MFVFCCPPGFTLWRKRNASAGVVGARCPLALKGRQIQVRQGADGGELIALETVRVSRRERRHRMPGEVLRGLEVHASGAAQIGDERVSQRMKVRIVAG